MNGDMVRTVVRGIGQTLMTVGVVLLLFVFYTLYVTNLFAAQDQNQLADDLSTRWSVPAASQPAADPAQSPPAPGEPAPAEPPQVAVPDLGEAYARLYLPSLGRGTDRPLVAVQGVSTADLQKGPGHLPDTASPGDVGNTVFSGHRTTYGAPFADLGELGQGQAVVVETRTDFYTYTVTGTQIVAPTAVEVTFPVPGARGRAPTQRLLTLTTCNPKYSARQRLIIRGELTDTYPKTSGGLPAALVKA